MQLSDKPLCEEARLAALHEYRVLDTDPERDYDDLASLAASLFGAPIAAISLVDSDRQWLKASIGLEDRESARDVAICAQAIELDSSLVVEDASQDGRFKTSPLVTDSPGIRFYAGTQLVTPRGLKIGTLCVIDRVPRQATDQQIRALEALGRQVVNLLEARKSASMLASALERVQLLSHLLPVCSHCDSVRDDERGWQSMEEFLGRHAGVEYSHGICPSCLHEHYGDVMQRGEPSN